MQQARGGTSRVRLTKYSKSTKYTIIRHENKVRYEEKFFHVHYINKLNNKIRMRVVFVALQFVDNISNRLIDTIRLLNPVNSSQLTVASTNHPAHNDPKGLPAAELALDSASLMGCKILGWLVAIQTMHILMPKSQ